MGLIVFPQALYFACLILICGFGGSSCLYFQSCAEATVREAGKDGPGPSVSCGLCGVPVLMPITDLVDITLPFFTFQK